MTGPAEDRVRVNRTAKDSVFVDLFDRPAYLFQLYRVLHPEDTETRESDLTVVTLENLLLREHYNDLGFLAGDRLVVLVEAQSTWSVNIAVRFLLYLADTYRRYISASEGMSLYAGRPLRLPKPELYVIYTGSRKDVPDTISLRRDVFRQADCCVEVEARVIRESAPGDIVDQYISFTRIFNEQIRLHGRTREAVLETLRICRERDVLRDYFAREEAADVMFTLIDKDRELRIFLRQERQEARRKGLEEGREEGRAKGREEGRVQGREEGREEGRIQGAVAAYRELGIGEGDILLRLRDRYGLTEEEARRWLS